MLKIENIELWKVEFCHMGKTDDELTLKDILYWDPYTA